MRKHAVKSVLVAILAFGLAFTLTGCNPVRIVDPRVIGPPVPYFDINRVERNLNRTPVNKKRLIDSIKDIIGNVDYPTAKTQ